VAYAGVDAATHRGRQKWFGGFKTRREAEAFRLALAHHPAFAGGTGPYGSPRLRTGDYLRNWLEERRALGNLRERTARRHAEHIALHLNPHIGHIPLARLSPAAIQHLYPTLLKTGLSGSTVRRVAAVLHAALQDAVKRGLLIRNPQDNTTRPSLVPYEPVVPTPAQVIAYLDDARETATSAVFALYVLDHRVLSVHQQLVRAGRTPVFGQPKTARGRRKVLLPPVAVDALRAALRWKKERRLKLGPKFRDGGTIFCGPTGRPLNGGNLYTRDHLVRLARLGQPRYRIHDLRHFHATHLIAANVDSRTMADRLGHADPGFLTRTYAHAVTAAQERAAAIANDLLTKTGQS